jgi:hypothetical protein
VQDTQTPPLLNAIYEQITRCAAGYNDLVDSGDITYDYVEDQAVADGSVRYPDFAHDQIPEEYRLRLQSIYTQFVDSQDCFREQLEVSRVHQQELHADLLAAEYERERLVSKRQRAKARCAEAEVTMSKLRADLAAAMDHLDRQTEAASSKDNIIQSVTEKSQVAHVRLKYAEDKIAQLNAKLQHERDRRHRKTKELLDEQVRVQDLHESEIIRLKQEAQDAQEQVDTLIGVMSELHADGRSPLGDDPSARHQEPTTRPYDNCQPPLPPERIQDTGTGTPPISPATNAPCTPSHRREDSSTLRDPTPEVTQDHRVALKKLFERMRQEENDSPPPIPLEYIHDTGTPPISAATNANSPLFSTKLPPHTLSRDHEGTSTHKGPTSEAAQDHWVALRKLFGRMREEENELETCHPSIASECVRDTGQEDSSTHQDPASEVTQDHRLAPEKSFGRMRQEENETCQPLIVSECIHDTGQEDSSTHQDPTSTSEVTQDHQLAPEKFFGRMCQDEHESTQDAVKPNSEQQESRLQDELAVTKEQPSLDEEERDTP